MNRKINLVPEFLSILKELMVSRCHVSGEPVFAIMLFGTKFFFDVMQSTIGDDHKLIYFMHMTAEYSNQGRSGVYSVMWDRDKHATRKYDGLVNQFLKEQAFYTEYVPSVDLMTDVEVYELFMDRMKIDLTEHL